MAGELLIIEPITINPSEVFVSLCAFIIKLKCFFVVFLCLRIIPGIIVKVRIAKVKFAFFLIVEHLLIPNEAFFQFILVSVTPKGESYRK